MSKRNKYVLFLINLLLIVICIVIIVARIWITVKYGGKPIDEIPSWVLWFMMGGK